MILRAKQCDAINMKNITNKWHNINEDAEILFFLTFHNAKFKILFLSNKESLEYTKRKACGRKRLQKYEQ